MQARWSLIRLMVCVGGLPVRPQPRRRRRRRGAVLTQGPPVSRTQCVAPWPPAHPCRAPAPLSLAVDCDRGQRRLSQSAASSHIHHTSFWFLSMATPPPLVLPVQQVFLLFINTSPHCCRRPPQHTCFPSSSWFWTVTQTLYLKDKLDNKVTETRSFLKSHRRFCNKSR